MSAILTTEGRAAHSRDGEGRSLVTRSSLALALREAGLSRGDVVCAHVGLSALGYVCGAAVAVIDALMDVLGADGTLMMPSFSGELSDPATWRFPPVPADWVEVIRSETPIYDPDLTPTRGIGVIAELFRHRPGARRSAHPHSSFAALGAKSDTLVANHRLNFRFGPHSPLGALAALDGKVLMLGTDNRRASLIYLGQFISGLGAEITKSAPLLVSGKLTWVEYRDVAVDNRLVGTGIDYLLRTGIARNYPAGDGGALVFSAREALVALSEWRWRDAGIDLSDMPAREPLPLPASWNDWLKHPDPDAPVLVESEVRRSHD